MSFAQYEVSVDEAQPISLYLFTLGNRQWRYTSAAEDVTTFDGKVWRSASISDDGVKQTGEAVSDALNIQTSNDIAPVQLYMTSPSNEVMGVTIFMMQASETSPTAVYVGEIAQINFSSPGGSTITCETLAASMRREGLRLPWQRACPYALYDPITCKVDKSLYAVACTIVSVDGMSITVDGLGTPADGDYDGGFIEWLHPVKGRDMLAIETHTGSTFLIFGSTVDLYAGLQITAYRGCRHDVDSCIAFGNYDNYGGVPNLPGKSPFDGDPLF